MTEEIVTEVVQEIPVEAIIAEVKEATKPTLVSPIVDMGEKLVARLVSIRVPAQSEGTFTIAEFEVHSRIGMRGRIILPYVESLGKLGSTWTLEMLFKETDQRNYLMNRMDTLDMVRDIDHTPVTGLV